MHAYAYLYSASAVSMVTSDSADPHTYTLADHRFAVDPLSHKMYKVKPAFLLYSQHFYVDTKQGCQYYCFSLTFIEWSYRLLALVA